MASVLAILDMALYFAGVSYMSDSVSKWHEELCVPKEIPGDPHQSASHVQVQQECSSSTQ